MDRITVKKIIEINLKKGKISAILKNNDTQNSYNNFIDTIDKCYKLKVCMSLSQLDTPMILVGHRFSSFYPIVYCFGNTYYVRIENHTTITTDLKEVLEIIDKFFYK